MSYKKLCKRLYKEIDFIGTEKDLYELYALDNGVTFNARGMVVSELHDVYYNNYTKGYTNPKKIFFKMAKNVKWQKDSAKHWLEIEMKKENIDQEYVLYLKNAIKAYETLEKSISKACVKYL